MIQLSGINLGQRQHELNKKVDELFKENESFEEISAIQEKSDVDKLLKIDLANLQKNVKYLVDNLKCGDSLYISRVLKCSSLFEDHDVINPDYIHHNIIPYMSQKMKRKLLTCIAIQVKDQERIDKFYQYCCKHKLHAVAFKFLIHASQQCKEEYLKSVLDIDDSVKFELFFGNSFDLINQYISKKKLNNLSLSNDLFRFSYLLSSHSENYLDMLEDCLEREKCTYYNSYKKYGLWMSKIVMTKHKQRVTNKPWLYLGVLNKSMISRHSTSDDAKRYAVALLPEKCESFWSMQFYNSYAFFLDKIPAKEFYAFLKSIFISKYPNELFEMNFSFYRNKYYKFMTTKERQAWALENIDEMKEHFGPLKDYKWYKFVEFHKAFYEIKKLIRITKSADVRSDLIAVLIESASHEDLEVLLSYYYERHVNEASSQKEYFLDKIIEIHDLYKLNDKCWTIFMKLLHSLKVFTTNCEPKYTFIAIFYNIINNKTIPQDLEKFCVFGRTYPWQAFDTLNMEQKEFIYRSLLEYFANKVDKLVDLINPSDETKTEEKKDLIMHIWSAITLIDRLEKPQQDCPESVARGIELYYEEFSYHHWFKSKTKKITEWDLLRLLKKDKNLLLDTFLTDKEYNIRCANLLKKIKIYFSDIATNITEFYEKKLSQLYADKNHYISYDPIIFNLMQLSDSKFKIKLMTEYAPESPKIVHDEIDRNLLSIQEAICKFMHIARPPVPLTSVQLYLKGDYVQFCLPIFNSYGAHLPFPASLQFIQTVLDSPVSIQKHGLRLAFGSYDVDNLIELIIKIWNKTKNASLRSVIFSAVINKIPRLDEGDQTKLYYEALKMFTLSLTIDDSEEIYDLLTTRLPHKMHGDFLKDAWTSVNRLPYNSSTYIERRVQIITTIYTYLDSFDRNVCRDIIEEHVNTMFVDKNILGFDDTYIISRLYGRKWDLIAKYITHFNNDQELEASSELLHKILTMCFDMWDEFKLNDGAQPHLIVREFLKNFLYSIKHNIPYKHDSERKPYINPIFQGIVDFFEEFLPINCVLIFDFKLAILFRNIIGDGIRNEDGEISYKRLEYETVAKAMAQGIINLVTEQYYPSLSKLIADKITYNVNEIISYTELESDQLNMIICRYLSEQNRHDLRLLALHMLSIDDCKEFENDFNVIINNIISSNDYDLNSYIYHNFIWRDLLNRVPQLNKYLISK